MAPNGFITADQIIYAIIEQNNPRNSRLPITSADISCDNGETGSAEIAQNGRAVTRP
jgi:hypothetical protein